MLKKLFILLAIFVPFIFPSKVFAASDTPIPGIHFPCNLTDNPEFASLRPYQAASCGDANKAYYCSNSLIFVETFDNFPICNSQGPENGHFVCDLGGGKYIPDHQLTVNLADVNEPILGNTDLTKNSQNPTDQIDDGTKVSEYLSWYLGGTLNKAETGSSTPTNISDWAGPIQKIMPQAMLDAQRIQSIANLDKQVAQITEDDITTGKTENAQHNQIVVCANHDGSGLWAGLQDLLGLGKYNPVDCYKGNGSAASGDLVMRLADWNATLGANVVINSIIQGFINGLKLIYPFIPSGALEQSISDHWTSAKPPLPWDDGTGAPFATNALYQKAYAEWRGNICAIIPLVNSVICVGNIFVPTKYADLFPYIPLANTTDTHGAEADFIAEIQPVGETEITGKSYDIPKSAPLWTAHNQEDKELSDFLNTSYTPKGLQSQSVAGDTEAPLCRAVSVSANIGDNTFAGQPHGIEVPNVHYTITKVPCNRTTEEKSNTQAHPNACPGGLGVRCFVRSLKCDAEISITLPTVTKTPWADEIWQSTVANSASTFRRIYPKVGNNAPVSCIADNPAASKVTYTPIDPVGNGADNFKVIDPLGANTTANPQLLYPHFGSVYDYFLQGIQQALRPEGYGTGTPVSGQDCSNIACGELPSTLPKATGACTLSSTGGINVPTSLKKLLEAAGQTYNVPPSLILGIMFGEGDFNTVGNGTYANGKYDWTDTNVKNWATCQKLPKCSGPDTSIVSFFDWDTLSRQVLPELKKIDPTKVQADPCNLTDALFVLAKNLHDNAGGSGSMTGKSCFGITMTSTNPGNCAWDSSQYETAIRVWEIGTTYDVASNKTCLTTNMSDLQSNGLSVGAGSCGTGIPTTAGSDYTQYLCRGGDNCETAGNHSSDTSINSHNACVWDIATSGSGGGNKR